MIPEEHLISALSLLNVADFHGHSAAAGMDGRGRAAGSHGSSSAWERTRI